MVIWEGNLHDQINMTKWIWPKFGEHDRKISEQRTLTIEYKYASLNVTELGEWDH